MKRLLFNVLAWVSLLLCMAAAVMWVRSCWRLERGGFWGQSSNYYPYAVEIQSMRGETTICWQYPASPPRPVRKIDWKWVGLSSPYGSIPVKVERQLHGDWKFLGFSLVHHVESFATWNNIVIPYWFILFVTGFLPGWWMVVTRKRRRQAFRQANHLCLTCGYDLRATPWRCPECGTIPQKLDQIST